jgi:hypothetical protein
VACVDRDALGSAVVFDGEPETLTVKCPGARDADETGGVFAAYRGAVWPEDATAEVNCTVE